MDNQEEIDNRPESEDEATETTPKGLEVRTPSRDEFFGNLRKVTKTKTEDDES
jgi:hypothetical protein